MLTQQAGKCYNENQALPGLKMKMNKTEKQFAICIDNTDYEVSLIPRKIYPIIPDERAAQDDLIRIVDESGEDYLYHISHFVLVGFPAEVEQVLVAA